MILQEQVLNLINQERLKNKIGILIKREDLTPASNLRAQEASVLWSHTRPNGKQYFSVNDAIYGENLSRGYKTASEIVRAWMNSDTHRAVMLDPRYKGASIGIYNNKKLYVSLELTK